MRKIALILALALLHIGAAGTAPEARAQSALERADALRSEEALEYERIAFEAGIHRGSISKREFEGFVRKALKHPAFLAQCAVLRDLRLNVIVDDRYAVGDSSLIVDVDDDLDDILFVLQGEDVEIALHRRTVVDAALADGLQRYVGEDFEDFEDFYFERVRRSPALLDLFRTAQTLGVTVYAGDAFQVRSNWFEIDMHASNERIIEFFERGE